ncbi:hypothetical protein K435DRAFT_792789 [Dendrothele bispora CBS 962.96]|uniref:DUF6532 domain-containing protein n=1 Tax=Dendrothele bispora (strain CBS 962.96) TaxID=1314807 RepID=A0A4S8MHP6_DENBC|nr:hypothetical protein K435DRAFT_792789 [Dendrothele bispora CBS 962.96]
MILNMFAQLTFHHKPAISDDDFELASSDEELVIVRPDKKASKLSAKSTSSDDSTDESGEESGSEEEPGEDNEAACLFDDEAPVFIEEASDEILVPAKTHHRQRSCSSVYSNDDLVSLDTGFTDIDSRPASEVEENVVDVQPLPAPQNARKHSTKQEKLRNELSRVINNPAVAPTTNAHVTASSQSSPTPSAAPGVPQWLPHTDIAVITKGRSVTLGPLSSQSKIMHDVINCSIKIVNEEIKQLGSASLDAAAEELNLTQDNGVSPRLQDGDHNAYIKPLVNYSSHRIGLERKDLKLSQIATVLSAFGFGNDPASRLKAQTLVLNYTYHYGNLPSGEYDPVKPFEHAALSSYIGAMFFGTHAYAGLLGKNKNLELPKGLVALSVAAIHAILSDYSRQCNENFPSKELAGVWKSALAILSNIEKVNKTRYHQLMHKLYINASGSLSPAGTLMTNQQIMDVVDWSAFADTSTSVTSSSDQSGTATSTVVAPA